MLRAKSCLAVPNTNLPSRDREGHPHTPVVTAELTLKSTLGMEADSGASYPSSQGWLQWDRAVPDPTRAEEG